MKNNYFVLLPLLLSSIALRAQYSLEEPVSSQIICQVYYTLSDSSEGTKTLTYSNYNGLYLWDSLTEMREELETVPGDEIADVRPVQIAYTTRLKYIFNNGVITGLTVNEGPVGQAQTPTWSAVCNQYGMIDMLFFNGYSVTCKYNDKLQLISWCFTDGTIDYTDILEWDDQGDIRSITHYSPYATFTDTFDYSSSYALSYAGQEAGFCAVEFSMHGFDPFLSSQLFYSGLLGARPTHDVSCLHQSGEIVVYYKKEYDGYLLKKMAAKSSLNPLQSTKTDTAVAFYSWIQR